MEWSQFLSRIGIFANTDYASPACSPSRWWRKTASTYLRAVAVRHLEMQPTNQAAEHGWAHLSRTAAVLRTRLQ
eukprot:2227297-Prorocentrum_lima.AAC.1